MQYIMIFAYSYIELTLSQTFQGNLSFVNRYQLYTTFVLLLFLRAAALEEMDTLKAWKAADVDFNVADYDKRTALHVVIIKRKF